MSIMYSGPCFDPANVNITGGSITGITDLAVADGGTGASTLTDHGVLVGSGTGAITPLTVGATGEVLSGATGADPVFTSTPTVSDITLSDNVFSNPTYKTLGDYIDLTCSSGYVSGGLISDLGGGSGGISITQLEGLIKITDSEVAVTKFFTLNSATFMGGDLTDNAINYVYVDYNAGTPKFAVTADRTTIKTTTQFPLGRVYKAGTDIEILQSGIHLQNYIRRNHERLVSRGNMERMSGSVISATGTRQVAVTAGVWYVGANKLSFGAIDSSATNFDHYYYYTGAAWTETAATGTIDNTNYNNVASGLAELTANRYGVHWVYQCFEGEISVVYGQGDYTLSQAEASKVPSSIPDYLVKFGVLIGRIIIKKSASSFASVESVYDTTFIPETVTTHNNLAGLQGGTADQYYHLTSAEYTGTGTNEFVRKTSPTLVTPALGTPASGDLQNCTQGDTTKKGVWEGATNAETATGESTTLVVTPDDVKYRLDATCQNVVEDLSYLPPVTFTWDPGSLADGVGETSSAITVPGATLGSTAVQCIAPYDLQGITLNAYCDAANSCKARLQNETTGTIDLASGTWTMQARRI